LVRRNRELVEVGSATDEETLSLVRAEIGCDGPAEVENWCVVAIRDLTAHTASFHLIGDRRLECEKFVSPPVVAIAKDWRVCVTQSSAIALGHCSVGAPTPGVLIAIAKALREWGIDQEYGLDAVTPEEIQRDTG
jgi:hypothetical protein